MLVLLLSYRDTQHGACPGLLVILPRAKTWTSKMSPKNEVASDPKKQNVVPTAIVGVAEPRPWPARIRKPEHLTPGKFR